MGDTQRLSPDEQIKTAREAYENGHDFTVAVEEEFAVLDPETLGLANRFEELQAAAHGTPLEEHLVGELIASEVEIRICDAQPELAEARALAALGFALTARIARALDEGEPLPSWPHRLLEENLWRAIRWGLSGELIDLDLLETVPARARLERFVEWVLPVAEELGAAQWLAIPERNAAERQIARHEEGATMEQIFAEQVGAGEPVGG